MIRRRLIASVLALTLALLPAAEAAAGEMVIAEPALEMEVQDIDADGLMSEESAGIVSAEGNTAGAGDAVQAAEENIAGTGDAVQVAEENIAGTGDDMQAAESDTFENDLSPAEGASDEDDLVLSVEVVEDSETVSGLMSDSDESLLEEEWEFEGTVKESGRADNAAMPKMRVYGESVYVNSFGGQLDGNAKKVYDSMVQTFVKSNSLTKVVTQLDTPLQYTPGNAYEAAEVGIEIDYMVQAAFDAFKYDYPEIYWLGLISYGASAPQQVVDGRVVKNVSEVVVIPYEDYDGASSNSEKAAFSSAVSRAKTAVSGSLSSGSSTRDKVRAIHDYICQKAYYDDNYASYADDSDETAYIHSAAGVFLKNGAAVCEGYAKAFKILCAQFGIESVLITGDAGGGHMWNYVKMDDANWYLVDATWDDRDDGIDYTYFLAGSCTKNEYGTMIGLERMIYLNFSPSDYTKTFAVPVLNSYSYDVEHPVHTHSWVPVLSETPTCQNWGYEIRECACGDRTVEVYSATEHSFKNAAVYNNDATCISDGTKTYYCDYGCGTAGKTVAARGTKLTPTITVNAESLRLKKGQSTTKFKVSGLGLGDYVDSWKSTKPSVVKVSGKADGTCKITAKKVGKATIVITLKSGLEKRIKVTVQKTAVKTTKISDVPSELTLKKGETYQLAPTILPITSKQKKTYTSSNKKVATVSKSGKIKAKKKGKAVITVRCGSKTKKCKITVQ